tara:strand:+ start:204 stop:527 length:324 start_codon:yes stop_codon:yes gene_type:complete
MEKYTTKKILEARECPMVKKWRASGRNSSIIPSPTIQEIKERSKYAHKCESYVNTLISEICKKEKQLFVDLRVKGTDYYTNRYDLTSTEVKIVRNAIFQKLQKNKIC